MSQVESKVEAISEYIDTEYSGGDSNKMKLKQFYQEENNNDIDEITKDFSDMGCIVDTLKRPPNICVETCVYNDSDSDHDNEKTDDNGNDNDDVHYSDEFEEDSEVEEINAISKSENNSTSQIKPNESIIKMSKSHSSVSSKPPSMSGRSGTSTGYGSISVPQTRRINMSFTNERLREIERHNHILLNKILCARNNRKSSIPPREGREGRKPVPPAAVHRKNKQRQIDHDNMILLKKIQRAKSSACSIRR
ncbi:cilia- and flagella-associated protein 97-like [Colias croceus]|uniref:cilia- and flagella-associated protein 97-like n=1 Tax=Colias crocea TaxID=72248 RepID=UPI001E27F407|nr:cilia- and flagella-associated protein 97-like [Colias croceus]